MFTMLRNQVLAKKAGGVMNLHRNVQNTDCLPNKCVPLAGMFTVVQNQVFAAKKAGGVLNLRLQNTYCCLPNKGGPLAGRMLMSKNQIDKQFSIFNVNTLLLRKRLQMQGLPPKVAVAVATSMTEIINRCLETVSASFAFQVEREKANLVFEAKFLQIKEELQKSQRLKVMANLHEIEKFISFEVEKVRSELRHDINKEVACMRLLFSTIKLDLLKYAVGGVFSLCGVILAILRMMP